MEKAYNKRVMAGVVFIVLVASGFFLEKMLLKPKTTVDVADVEIKLHTGNSGVKMGASQNALISALGAPKQIAAYSLQANYKQGTVLNYNGAKFYFIHDKLTNFEITSHKFNVGLTGTHQYTAIGNKKADLPHFKIQDRIALLDVTSEDSTTDQYLEYDLNDNGAVTKISYSDY